MKWVYHYASDDLEHPGVLLEEKLREMGMSVKEFASRADKPEQSVLEILHGTCSITPEMALVIEFVTGMSAAVLLNWQKKYDERSARNRCLDCLGNEESWLSLFPLEEMIRRGWIDRKPTVGEQVDAVLRYFGVASPVAWENYYFRQRLKVAFRISLADAANPHAVASWLRKGELLAMETPLEMQYDAKKLKDSLPSISLLLQSPPDDLISRLGSLLAGFGVKLIFTEPLSGIPVKGAARWIYGWPCIQLLSERHFYDNFRFTVLHEIGHVLLHGKKDIFLEKAGFFPSDDPSYDRKEREADDFARKWEAFSVDNQ